MLLYQRATWNPQIGGLSIDVSPFPFACIFRFQLLVFGAVLGSEQKNLGLQSSKTRIENRERGTWKMCCLCKMPFFGKTLPGETWKFLF